MELVPQSDRGAALVQLARAAGELGDRALFDRAITDALSLVYANPGTGLTSLHALHEVHLRGLVHTGRPGLATDLLDDHRMSTTAIQPQWQAILHVTTGEVFLARADTSQAETAFQAAIAIAEEHRLPHQIQRSLRVCTSHLPTVAALARQSLERLRIPAPDPAGTQAP